MRMNKNTMIKNTEQFLIFKYLETNTVNYPSKETVNLLD